jgi:hypothetical protein
MRISQIHATNILPVKLFSVAELSDIVVFAGPNGVGKTRLISALLSAFQSGGPNPNMRLVIEATNQAERDSWGRSSLDTGQAADCQKLTKTLQRNRSRNRLESSVINFESDRTIQRIQPYSFTWDITDPWEEQIGGLFGFGGLRDRFQDTLHSLFRKMQSRRDAIARTAEALIKEGKTSMNLDFPDPLLPFKNAFSQLLAPKILLDPEAKQQELRYSSDGQEFPVSALSSGEREVVNIVFDFLLRNPSNSIVIFDEPELHLHPELSYKLLQALKTVGDNNQFIYCTHSPDIITASLDHSVVFVGPPKEPLQNQALVVREDDETHQALKLLGQSIGIVALGKRLVLIEGTEASLDKQAYGSILKNRFPGLVQVPSGGKGMITSFASILGSVLEQSIWGVEFFMLCDRDAIPSGLAIADVEVASKGRLRVLSRYHLENYFLDEHVLAAAFASMEPPESWLRNPVQIRAKLRELAGPMVSYTAALDEAASYRNRVGYIDLMPKGSHGKTAEELIVLMGAKATAEVARVSGLLDVAKIDESVKLQMTVIQRSLDADDDIWKQLIPGKQLFSKFSAAAKLDAGRVKTLYLREAERSARSPFQDIIDIFEGFANS